MLFWTSRSRLLDKPPLDEVNKDIKAYGQAWRDWYTGLMPDWRAAGTPDRWPLLRNVPPGETWADVRKGERNGVLLLLLTLWWWKGASEPDSVARDEYESALEDVVWLMSHLARELDVVAESNPASPPLPESTIPSLPKSTSAVAVVSKDPTPEPVEPARPRTRKRTAEESLVNDRPRRKQRRGRCKV